jgi:integrase
VQTKNGLRYRPVVLSANGRIKPDWVIVNGIEERHPKGSYYLEWREGSKRVRQSVGADAANANARRQRKEAELNALNHGIEVVTPDNEGRSKQRPISDAITTYLAEIKISRRSATHSAYMLALRNFTASCTKAYLEEIDRVDLLGYVKYLREDLELSDRTCHNRFEHLLTFLKAQGVTGLAKKRDWPKYVQKEPESYDDEELTTFFAACDQEERVFFEFCLMTGFRKKELTYCCWPDVDLKNGVVRVTTKPEHGFRPKDWEEREVPIPDKLIHSLREWAKNRNGSQFVFPTRNGTPRKHRTQLLDLCKSIAERAGLDPDDFYLHKFRATFATKHLQAGVDLRTVQMWLGHNFFAEGLSKLRHNRAIGMCVQISGTLQFRKSATAVGDHSASFWFEKSLCRYCKPRAGSLFKGYLFKCLSTISMILSMSIIGCGL